MGAGIDAVGRELTTPVVQHYKSEDMLVRISSVHSLSSLDWFSNDSSDLQFVVDSF